MQKLKIMNVITRLVGGPAWHSIYLTKYMNDDRFESILVVGQPDSSEQDMLETASAHGVNPIKLPELKKDISPLSDLKAFIKLFKLIRREKPDVVHTHTAKAGILARLAARAARVPVVIHTFHGHVFSGYFGKVKTSVFITIERFLTRLSDKIVAISPSQREELRKYLNVKKSNEEKLTVIPLGFEFNKYLKNNKPILRKTYGINKRTKCIGIIGRLVPIKNHAMFLEAIEGLIRKQPNIDAKFFIIGDGELRTTLEHRIKENGLESYVTITGWQNNLEKIYPDLDATVLTSDNEGTPVSIIESIVSGCPVISTAVGGVPDIIEHGKSGILIEPGNVKQLSYYLEKVIHEDGFFKEKTSLIKDEFIIKFSAENLVTNLSQEYISLLGKKTR